MPKAARQLLIALAAAGLCGSLAFASTYNVGAVGGGSCGSGSLSPNSGNLTVQAGEAVKINFTVAEPTYPAGWDFSSSLWGTVHADSGSSVQASFTAPATAGNYSYQGTWPSNGCLKASATITVTAAAPPPAPTPTPTPTPTPAPPPAPTPTPTPAPQPAGTDTSKLNLDTTSTPDQSTDGSSLLDSNSSAKANKPVATATQASNSRRRAELIGLAVIGLGAVGGLGFWAWRLAGRL